MNIIPLLQSQTIRALLVAILGVVLKFAVVFGLDPDTINEKALQVIEALCEAATVAGILYAAYARVRLPTPPLTQAAAEKTAVKLQEEEMKAQNSGGFARVAYLFLVAAVACYVVAFAGCVTPPTKVIQVACAKQSNYRIERCASAVADEYKTYQTQALAIVKNASTPPKVKSAIQSADAAASPVMIELVKLNADYVQVKTDLAAGKTTEEKVAIANAKLAEWIPKAIERFNALADAVD